MKLTPAQLAEREEVANQNRQALVGLMEKYKLLLPQRTFDQWKPTRPTVGRIPGVADCVTCIASDGVLGYFVFDGPMPPLLGHTHRFEWVRPDNILVPYTDASGEVRWLSVSKKSGTPPALFSVTPEHKEKIRVHKPRKSPIQKALDVLAQLSQNEQT